LQHQSHDYRPPGASNQVTRRSPIEGPPNRAFRLIVALALVVAGIAWAETDTVLLLHTNDLHDHIRPDYDGDGGLTYVSGYIQREKATRDDVLVLDGGDVMEKGDLVAYRTQSRLMFEAMGRIGYDAVSPGNHDDAYGLDHYVACDALAPDMAILCINLFDEDGGLLFPASKVFDVDGVRVGVIGANRPRDEQSLTLEETAAAIGKESERLEPDVDLIVVVAHMGVSDCMIVSDAAPAVDVFIGGHTHMAYRNPRVYEPTGALMVQAGSYAEYVGRLEVTVDLETGAIVAYKGGLIAMDHDAIPNDEAMTVWYKEREAKLCPEANAFVIETVEPTGFIDVAFLGAEALRLASGAEIGFCHGSQIVRDKLIAGTVDVNAVFRTGGQRADRIVTAQLTGATIGAYLNGLAKSSWGQTQWSGFRGGTRTVDGRRSVVTDLDPERTYTIVMPHKEWETRFLRWAERMGPGVDGFTAEDRPNLSYTSAVVSLVRERAKDDKQFRRLLDDIKSAAID